jgi:hypothetical protein
MFDLQAIRRIHECQETGIRLVNDRLLVGLNFLAGQGVKRA